MQKNYTAKPYSARGILSILLPLLAIPALVFLLQIPWAPGNSSLSNDSGFFAYAGRQLLQGSRLYIDIFDTKTPGIYYINALALSVFGDSLWSIWIIQNLWASITTAIFYLILRKHMRPMPAISGVLFFLFTLHYPSYYQSGNLTEFYALLPQIIGLSAISGFHFDGKQRWLILLGLSTGLAVLFKPTYFGIGLAGSLAIGIMDIRKKEWKVLIRHALFVLAGFLIPLLAMAIFALNQGFLEELWYSTITYNMKYSEHGLSLRGIYSTLRALFFTPPLSYLNTISAGAAAIILSGFIKSGNNISILEASPPAESTVQQNTNSFIDIFWLSVFLGILLDWTLVFTSGRSHGHYFITPLPVIATSCAFIVSRIPEMLRQLKVRSCISAAPAMLIILCVVWGMETAVKNIPSPNQINLFLTSAFSEDFDRGSIADYMIDHTETSDTVYLWDDHAELLFLANRTSPTSVLYATQLLLPGIDHAAVFDELILELENNPPRLILSQTQSGVGLPYLGGPITELCTSIPADACPGLLELRAFLDDDYELAAEIGTWRIFERTP